MYIDFRQNSILPNKILSLSPIGLEKYRPGKTIPNSNPLVQENIDLGKLIPNSKRSLVSKKPSINCEKYIYMSKTVQKLIYRDKIATRIWRESPVSIKDQAEGEKYIYKKNGIKASPVCDARACFHKTPPLVL